MIRFDKTLFKFNIINSLRCNGYSSNRHNSGYNFSFHKLKKKNDKNINYKISTPQIKPTKMPKPEMPTRVLLHTRSHISMHVNFPTMFIVHPIYKNSYLTQQ